MSDKLEGKGSTRGRKLRELALVLPCVGAVFVGIPVLWPTGGKDGTAILTSNAGIYLFSLWMCLIVLAAILARQLQKLDKDS